MTILPIVGRELRVASRRRGTYWSRFGAALAAIGVFLWTFGLTYQAQPATVAKAAFGALSVLLFAWTLLCGMWNTSDCISTERRDGTLGLLFLTDLRGYDVASGKLVSHSLNTFYGLLATLPVMAIPILMGGVTWTLFGYVTLVLLNTMFLSLSVGLLASTLSKKGQQAAGLTFGLLALTCCVGPIIAAYLEGNPSISRAQVEWLVQTSPIYPLSEVLKSGMAGAVNSKEVLFSSAITHAMAWMAFVSSAVILPRVWQIKPKKEARPKWRKLLFFLYLFEKPSERGDRLTENPPAWLSARLHTSARSLWIAFAVGVGLMVWGYLETRNKSDFFNDALFWTVVFASTVVFKLFFAATCVRQFASDRRSGALELLLSTPLKIREVLAGYSLGLVRKFVWPWVAMMILQLLLFACAMDDFGRGDFPEVSATYLVYFAATMIDLHAMRWLGMWRGLIGASTAKASRTTSFMILTLPWLIFLLGSSLIIPIMAMAVRGGAGVGVFNRFMSEYGFWVALSGWATISIVISLAAATRSHRKLLQNLRVLATEPLGVKGPKTQKN